jgi:outer membrane protein assembly factor BamB
VRHEGDAWEAAPLWENRQLCSKFANPVTDGGHLYGLSRGFLVCVDAATGERRWKEGRFGHGQVLLAGGVLLVVSETGELTAVKADPAGYHEIGRLPVFDGKTWNTPALAGGRLYLRNHQEMACVALAD